MVKIILLTGKKAGGKSIFANICRNLKIPVFEMSDIIFDLMRIQKVKIDSISTGKFAENLRDKEGKEVVAKKVFEKTKTIKNNLILISGLRSIEELNYFKKYANSILINVDADDKIRFERIQKRGRKSDPVNYNMFLVREISENKLGINKLLPQADVIIKNNKGMEEFERKIKDLIRFIS